MNYIYAEQAKWIGRQIFKATHIWFSSVQLLQLIGWYYCALVLDGASQHQIMIPGKARVIDRQKYVDEESPQM